MNQQQMVSQMNAQQMQQQNVPQIPTGQQLQQQMQQAQQLGQQQQIQQQHQVRDQSYNNKKLNKTSLSPKSRRSSTFPDPLFFCKCQV